MASVVRIMEWRDMNQVKAIIGGEFPLNFLSVVYERDERILGWACSRVEGEQIVAQAAASKKISPFAVRRLVEALESYLVRLGLLFYVFGVHVKRKKWIEAIEKFGIYERYATKSMHHWYRRRLR